MHTIAVDLIQQMKKIAMTEDQNLVKSDHCLQLFSSRRQPPLLVKETPLAYVLKRGVS